MEQDSNEKKSEKKKEQEENQILKKIIEIAKETPKNLSETFKKWFKIIKKIEKIRPYLSEVKLEDLAMLTQIIGIIGKIIGVPVISISMIIAELRRRADRNGDLIEVKVGNTTIGFISSSSSEEDVENCADRLQEHIRNDTTVEYIIRAC